MRNSRRRQRLAEHKPRGLALGMACLLAASISALAPVLAGSAAPVGDDPVIERWETYTKADGLPSNKVLAVEVSGDRVWVGTEAGLAYLVEGRVETIRADAGLPSRTIVALDSDPVSGDLWIGTFSGLARWSAGRVDTFTQLSSGLANDVVYAIAVDGPSVWVATAVGLNRYDTLADVWEIFDVSNTLMHEPWCYGVTATPEKVYVAVWGGGVVELDKRTGAFRDHRDPDGEMELDLFRDDGLVHDVTSAVAVTGELLWVGTYFGLSRYDGRRWQSFSEQDSGLAGDFINALAADSDAVWIATDQGLSRFDSVTWHTWRRADDGVPQLIITGQGELGRASPQATGPASDMIFGVQAAGGDVWLATAAGLSHGIGRRTDVSNRSDLVQGAGQ